MLPVGNPWSVGLSLLTAGTCFVLSSIMCASSSFNEDDKERLTAVLTKAGLFYLKDAFVREKVS